LPVPEFKITQLIISERIGNRQETQEIWFTLSYKYTKLKKKEPEMN